MASKACDWVTLIRCMLRLQMPNYTYLNSKKHCGVLSYIYIYRTIGAQWNNTKIGRGNQFFLLPIVPKRSLPWVILHGFRGMRLGNPHQMYVAIRQPTTSDVCLRSRKKITLQMPNYRYLYSKKHCGVLSYIYIYRTIGAQCNSTKTERGNQIFFFIDNCPKKILSPELLFNMDWYPTWFTSHSTRLFK